MNQIYIHLGDCCDDMPVGSSHMWGYPDMLADTPVPMKPSVSGDYVISNASLAWGIDPVENPKEHAMGFIGQINLADLPEDCEPLPHSGLLLFFGNISYYKGFVGKLDVVNEVSSPRQVRVIYIPGDKMDSLVRREDAIVWRTPKPVPMTIDHEPELNPAPQMELFGKPELMPYRMMPEPYKDWIVLWQTGSMESSMFDCKFNGRLYYIISREALAALDFSDVRAIVVPEMMVKVSATKKVYECEDGESTNFDTYLLGIEMKDPVCVNDLLPTSFQDIFSAVNVQITPEGDKLKISGGYGDTTIGYKKDREFVTPEIVLDDGVAQLSVTVMHREDVWKQMVSNDFPEWYRGTYWSKETAGLIEALLLAKDKASFQTAYEAITAKAHDPEDGSERQFMRALGNKSTIFALASYLADRENWAKLKELDFSTPGDCLSSALWFCNQIRQKCKEESVRCWPSTPSSPRGVVDLMMKIYATPEYWQNDGLHTEEDCRGRAERLKAEYKRLGY